ncbi:MAG: hypothetical protein ABW061_23595, partial [Polyangiaceae bacterium]
MTLRFCSALVLVSSFVAALGCSANGSPPGSSAHPGSGGGGNIVTGNGGTGNSLITGGGTETTRDPNDTRDVPVRQKVCDAAGKCTCLRLALLGTLASAAVDSDSDAFVSWLNTNSDGTATLTKVPTKPTIDAAFLANYDILLVANVNGWSFSDDEKAAVGTWVTGSGGGIVTITGFTSTATEAAATSQLVSFAGMGYSGSAEKDWTAPASGETSPVYYKGGSVDLKQCLEWNGTASGGVTHTSPRITTPIKFTPQSGQMEKLTLGLDYVGAFIGWPALAPAGSTVLAKDPVSGGNMAVAYEYQGKGRIFTFGDEWVIFTNQWVPVAGGTPAMNQADASNKCYVPAGAAGNAAAFFHSVQTLYQTKQFWYDVINWVAPPNECNFVVKDPDVVV